MSPSKVIRDDVVLLTDLPNIGKSLAGDLQVIGIKRPAELRGRDPYEMYATLCEITAQRHDPCVIDVFISVTRFVAGEAPTVWWAFTDERKRTLLTRSAQRNAPR